MIKKFNQIGQAVIEVIIICGFSLIALNLIFYYGTKIINNSLEAERVEEAYICQKIAPQSC